uniref:NID domain-containing protein n=1 Tax=Pavo cristatus TaxID=9049 RepID=A0A8C9FRL2_PAVCR
MAGIMFFQLNKVSARTVVISGVPDGVLNDDVMSDILVIHFQKTKNNGGDVEEVKYPTREKGVAYITFEDQEGIHTNIPQETSQELALEPHDPTVFSSVTSVLDMSLFKDKFVLEDLIQELKTKSTALSFGSLQPNGHISVQGSFPAIKWLRDFLLLKAKSLSEDKNEESKSHQKPKRRLQKRRLTREMNNFVRDAEGEKQVVVLDTDIYHYMKCFSKELFANTDVVISHVIDGDITTLHLQKGRSRSDAGQVLRVKEKIENQSIKLHNSLRKERISLERCTRDKKKYRAVCENVKSRHPDVLDIHYDTHIDVIGSSSAVFEFTQEVNKKIQSLFQNR